MKTLALDTSGSHQSVAVLKDGKLCSEVNLESPSSHTVSLLASIQKVLEDSSSNLSDMNLFAVTVGPGSFTGIRIGLSTLKGIGRVHPRPVAGVSALLALALPQLTSTRWVISCLDARLGELYTAAYRLRADGAGVEVKWKPQTMEIKALMKKSNQLSGEKIILGTGKDAFPEIVTGIEGAVVPPAEGSHRIRAFSVGLLGEQMLDRKEVVSGNRLSPVYLRISEAERRRHLHQKAGSG